MARYRKPKVSPTRSLRQEHAVIGMLYIVSVRFTDRRSREITKQRLLVVGSEEADIERKLRWIYETDNFCEFALTSVEKVREKIHVLSTVVTQPSEPKKNTILREEGRQEEIKEPPTPDLPEMIHYAVGITTRVYARDHYHALRKIAAAINEHATDGPTSTTSRLSSDSVLQIEEIPKTSPIARARDVSNRLAPAQFVRG